MHLQHFYEFSFFYKLWTSVQYFFIFFFTFSFANVQFHWPQPVWQHQFTAHFILLIVTNKLKIIKKKWGCFQMLTGKGECLGCFWRWFLMLRGQWSFDCAALDFISTGNVPCRHAGRLCLQNELTFTLLIAWGDCLKMLEEREEIAVVRAAGQWRLNYIHTNRCARKIND